MTVATERSSPDVSTEVVSEPFTTFKPWEKRYIIFLAAFAGMFSPMSSFVFYPAITAISQSLNISVGLVNLAISAYATLHPRPTCNSISVISGHWIAMIAAPQFERRVLQVSKEAADGYCL